MISRLASGQKNTGKKNKHTIQIEINRSIYLNEKTREKNSNFENCKLILSEMINNFEKNKRNCLT